MLYLALAYTIISAICLWAGWLFYKILPASFATAPNTYARPVILYLLTGLMLLAGIGQWTVLFGPLNSLALSLVLLGLAVLTFAGRRHLSIIRLFSNALAGRPAARRRPPVLFIIGGGALLLMIIILNAGPTIMDDTDSYHIQMIKWAQEYGTVPGIANLHLRFGFNSSWFIAIGLLCPRMTGIDHYRVLNGLLSCWFCYYFLEKIFHAFERPAGEVLAYPGLASAFLLVAGLLIWPMVRGNAASANYDFISTCCILVLLSESAGLLHPSLWVEWMVWPCFLFTVRMTNAPLLLLTVIAGIGYFAYRKRFPWPCLFLAAFFVIPFLFRNFLLSGYPLFPLYQFDFFKADWKADKSELIQIGEFIKYYNRSGGDPERVRHLSFPYWLAEWFRQLYTYNKVLIVLSLLCWTWMALHWKKWTDRRPTVVKGMVLTLAGSILCWFITGPDPRFNYGALLAGPFLIILLYPRHPFFSLTSKVLLPTGRARGIFMVCLTLCIFTYSIIKILTIPAYRNLTTPRSLPLPAYRELTIDGIAVRIPEKILDNWNPRCYDLALPCLYRVNPRLRSRGRNIRDGFRLDGPARGMNPRLPIGPDNPAEDDGEFKLE